MDGICIGCGKKISDISQEICDECRAKISSSEQTWQEYIKYLEGMGKLIEAERDKLLTENAKLRKVAEAAREAYKECAAYGFYCSLSLAQALSDSLAQALSDLEVKADE